MNGITDIIRIRHYDVGGRQIGIGYLDGKLVEFLLKKDGGSFYEEITLVQSLEWIEKMHYSQIRLPTVTASYDGGALRWFRDIVAALKNPNEQTTTAKSISPSNENKIKSVTIGEAIKQVIAAKKNANRSPRYVLQLDTTLHQFAKGREKMPIETITTEIIEAWIAKYKNPQTRQTWVNRLSALLSFAVRRDWILKNPCEKIEGISVDRKPPAILTPKQAETLLADCPDDLKPYFILSTWAGMRPEEIVPMKMKGQPHNIFDWSSINLAEKVLKVERTKVRRRRIVPLEPRAVELLKPFLKESGPVAPSHIKVRRWHKRARAILGLDRFPTDLLRHTAASYLVALHNDAAKVALMLGNSANIIMTHYRNIVPEADCKAFWGI